MKNKFLHIILIFLVANLCYSQKYINIGSTKDEVRRVQGAPKSVQINEYSNSEVWGYGERGQSTIEFKNEKIVGYNNFDGSLKIDIRGVESQLNDKSDKVEKKEDVLEKLLNSDLNKYDDTIDKSEIKEMTGNSSMSPGIPIKENQESSSMSFSKNDYLEYSIYAIVIIVVIFFLNRILKKQK